MLQKTQKILSVILLAITLAIGFSAPSYAALNKINTQNPIRGIVHPTARQRTECQQVIAQLTFADMSRGAGTRHGVGSARLDVQGRTATGVNLQVQIGTGTAAAALVDNSVLGTTNPINQTGAKNGAVSVLNQSLDSGTIWHLTGSLP